MPGFMTVDTEGISTFTSGLVLSAFLYSRNMHVFPAVSPWSPM
eukprot:CAMPEP_0196998026 /NCGR_PEP_ID=MMETSP1380-20130617/3516_1 /TAXON_ID=5936 /ORGANISM="Euplotes crassus, Strain CT5" /LENGTH=42 /DNA_ID= /DNA_START= /DNA_END= /DNA_ORIENTATION=